MTDHDRFIGLTDQLFSEMRSLPIGEGFDPAKQYFDPSVSARYRKCVAFKRLLKAGPDELLSIYRGAAVCLFDAHRGRHYAPGSELMSQRHGIAEIVLNAIVSKAPLSASDDLALLRELHPAGGLDNTWNECHFFPVAKALSHALNREGALSDDVRDLLGIVKHRVENWNLHFEDKFQTSILIGCRLRKEMVVVPNLLSEGAIHRESLLISINKDLVAPDLEPVARVAASVTGPQPTAASRALVTAVHAEIPAARLEDVLGRWLDEMGAFFVARPATHAGCEEVRLAANAIVWIAALSPSPQTRAALQGFVERLEKLGAPKLKALLNAARIEPA